MVDYRAKFDSELRDIHTSYLDLRRGNRERAYPHHSKALEERPLSLLLQFADDLAGIEARGFRTEWVEGRFARGDVELADLEAVASHPDVIQLAYGGRYQPKLDTSVPEITARGPNTTAAVWTVNTTTGVFAGSRGDGVLIGVVDTGIDIHHPVFLKPGSNNVTRIMRIWDQGIPPHDGIPSPDVSLLQGSVTYGVEYTEQMINDVLQKKPGAKKIKHRDCYGHGTHVASIAAGDGRAKVGKKQWEFVGAAPEAALIVVKLFFLQQEPPVDEQRRLEDAFTYVERVAKTKLNDQLNNAPVVINASLGENLGPHDGLVAFDHFLETRFKGATRKALVAAAGNDAGSRQHGVIAIPTAGKIDVPFTLYDERRGVVKDKSHCDARPNGEKEIVIEFWYRPPAAPGTVTAVLHPPKGPAINAPAVSGSPVSAKYPGGFTVMVSHDADEVQRPPGTKVTRNVLRIKFLVKSNSYGTGPCTLTMNGPAGTTVHAWCNQFFPNHGIRIGHDRPGTDKEPDVMKRLKPLPAGVTVPDSVTVNSPASSAGAIAVAAYDDDSGQLAGFSSQGDLVDYSTLGPYVAKPDIAAPGVTISAANAAGSFLSAFLTVLAGKNYVDMDGTSMATPHVSGVAALMFQKKPNLSLADLVKQLKGKARPTPPKQEFGDGKVAAKASFDAV